MQPRGRDALVGVRASRSGPTLRRGSRRGGPAGALVDSEMRRKAQRLSTMGGSARRPPCHPSVKAGSPAAGPEAGTRPTLGAHAPGPDEHASRACGVTEVNVRDADQGRPRAARAARVRLHRLPRQVGGTKHFVQTKSLTVIRADARMTGSWRGHVRLHCSIACKEPLQLPPKTPTAFRHLESLLVASILLFFEACSQPKAHACAAIVAALEEDTGQLAKEWEERFKKSQQARRFRSSSSRAFRRRAARVGSGWPHQARLPGG